jgi:hypothetical protein
MLVHVRIFVSGDLSAEFDDRHPTPHSAVELRHFEANGATADHRQMIRKLG